MVAPTAGRRRYPVLARGPGRGVAPGGVTWRLRERWMLQTRPEGELSPVRMERVSGNRLSAGLVRVEVDHTVGEQQLLSERAIRTRWRAPGLDWRFVDPTGRAWFVAGFAESEDRYPFGLSRTHVTVRATSWAICGNPRARPRRRRRRAGRPASGGNVDDGTLAADGIETRPASPARRARGRAAASAVARLCARTSARRVASDRGRKSQRADRVGDLEAGVAAPALPGRGRGAGSLLPPQSAGGARPRAGERSCSCRPRTRR